MNITELLPKTEYQTPHKNQQQVADFSAWLTKHPANREKPPSPAYSNAGDEYYWLHQTQLQCSELHFDAHLFQLPSQPAETVALNHKQRAATLPAHPELIESVKQQLDLLASSAALHPVSSTGRPINSIVMLPATQKLTLSYGVHGEKLTIESAVMAKNMAVQKASIFFTPFKNNHLFIQETDAELTLNLQAFTQEEQQELLQFVQDYLKKKGFVLSRLIINGVQHD